MRKFIIVQVFFIIVFTLNAQDSGYIDDINTIITDIKNKYAPDSRTAIFEIEIVGDSLPVTVKGKTNILTAKEEFIKMCESIDVKIIDDIEELPGKDLGDKVYGLVNLSVANIRSKPNHPAELATQALLGTPVKVLEYADGFYRVQTPDEYISWVDGDGIYRVTRDELDSWLNSDRILYLKENGYIYSNPDVKGERVSDVVMGDILRLESEEDGFYKVSFPDGRTGYIEKEFSIDYNKWLKIVDPSESKVLNTAKLMMGTPYLWGGTSSKGMDCSGFTKTVYFMNGIILPRDASQQVHTGYLVDTDEGFDKLHPGDLLFFGRKASEEREERITHVGIYIGNLEYIHASGKVKINSFDPDKENYSKYRHRSFIRAKRILNSLNQNGIFTVDQHKFYKGQF